MKTLTILLAMTLILFTTVSTFSQGSGRVHVVRKGDTLWDLSAFYLSNPFLWPSIWQANKTYIKDPHWIYPGQNFLIPPYLAKKGKIHIRPKKEKGVTKVEAILGAAPIIAAHLAFKGGFITQDKIETGYIVESEPKNKTVSTSADTVYIDLGDVDGVQVGDLFTIFRMGKKIKHPKTGKYYGKAIDILGKLVVLKVSADVSVTEIIQSFDIIKNHDMIMPFEPLELPTFTELITPETFLEGCLVATKKGSIQVIRTISVDETIIPFNIVYIDLGEIHGISPGDYFEIIRKGIKVKDPGPKKKVELPEILVGGLQVLRTTNETSTCYITEIYGNLDIEPGEIIRLKGKVPGSGEIEEFEIEEEFEEIEEEEEEEIIEPE